MIQGAAPIHFTHGFCIKAKEDLIRREVSAAIHILEGRHET